MTNNRFLFALAALVILPATVRAAEFNSDTLYEPTKIWTAHFTIGPDQWKIMQPRIDPIDPQAQVGAGLQVPGRRNGYAARMGWVFDPASADFEFDGKAYKNVSVRYKGNGSFVASRGSLKISMKVDLNKNVKGQRLAGLKELNFHSNVRDVSFMNEMLAYRLYRAVGVPAARVSYARVFLTVPGLHERRYVGLYSMVESLDEDYAERAFGEKDGAIFKPVTPNFFGYRGESWEAYEQEWDPKTDLTEAQKKRVIEFTSFVTSSSDADFANRIGDYLEVEKFARMLATTVYVGSFDGLLSGGQNIYVYLSSTTNRFTILPWDHDEAWGTVVQTQDIRNTLNVYQPMLTQKWIVARLLKLEAFRKPYLETLAQIALNHGRPDKLAAQQDELVPILKPAIREQNDEALALFEVATTETVVPRLVGVGFNPYLSLKAFSKARERSVIEQLATR